MLYPILNSHPSDIFPLYQKPQQRFCWLSHWKKWARDDVILYSVKFLEFGHPQPSLPAELLKTNSGWNKGGPTSVTSGHLHPGLPWRPAARAWRHGSKTIMRRLAWVERKSSLAELFLYYVFLVPSVSTSTGYCSLIQLSVCLLFDSSLVWFVHLCFLNFVFPLWHAGTHFQGSYAFQKVQGLLVPTRRIETSGSVNFKTLFCSERSVFSARPLKLTV